MSHRPWSNELDEVPKDPEAFREVGCVIVRGFVLGSNVKQCVIVTRVTIITISAGCQRAWKHQTQDSALTSVSHCHICRAISSTLLIDRSNSVPITFLPAQPHELRLDQLRIDRLILKCER